MGCCACAGSCNHIGPHSYCQAHGGADMTPLADTQWVVSPPLILSAPSHDHCFCLEARTWPEDRPLTIPHRQCCQCNQIMADQFIEGLQRA